MLFRALLAALLVLAAAGALASDKGPTKRGVDYPQMEKGCAAYFTNERWKECRDHVYKMWEAENAYKSVLEEMRYFRAEGYGEHSFPLQALKSYAARFSAEQAQWRARIQKTTPQVWRLN